MTEIKPYNSEFVMSKQNYWGRLVATAAKYVTLLGGIYSVCKDDKDFMTAAVFGMGYIAADVVKDALREVTEVSRISVLEKKLEE